MSLADHLAGPAVARVPAPRPPSDFTPRLEVGDRSALIVTPAATSLGPRSDGHADYRQIIADHGLDPDAWQVVTFRRASWQKHDGEWLESHRVTLAPAGAAPGEALDVDLAALHAEARAAARPAALQVREDVTLCVFLADAQMGKVDARGGTVELLARLEESRAALVEHARRVRPDRIILADLGDAVEGFENTAAQARTNDLQHTEQLRLWRRILLSWVKTCAELAPSVTVAGIPSNHCRVRRGKDAVAGPSDDYGLEAIHQVHDICAASPTLQHVEFFVPPAHEESLALPLPGGRSLGITHGHLVSNPDRLPQWWANQALGDTAVGRANYLVHGHFHHARVTAVAEDRWLFGCPTADNGSSWWKNISGRDSAPAVMVFEVDQRGWSGLAYV